jgi:hypothetical protein
MDGEPIPTVKGVTPHPGRAGMRPIRRELLFAAAALVVIVLLGAAGLFFRPTHNADARGTMLDPNTNNPPAHAPAHP